jgi:hypothetical protein
MQAFLLPSRLHVITFRNVKFFYKKIIFIKIYFKNVFGFYLPNFLLKSHLGLTLSANTVGRFYKFGPFV